METSVLRAALTCWDIDLIISIEAVTAGTMNDTFLVRTATGPLVLRRHRSDDKALVEREHDLTEYARTGGVPAPAVVPARDGGRLAEAGSRLYSLYRHAPGHQVERTRLRSVHAAAMGATLARLHEVIKDATPVQLPSTEPTEPPSVDATLARLRELREIIRGLRAPEQSDRWALQRLDGRIGWLERHPEPAPQPDPTDLQTIHGDYQESNVFFDDTVAVSAVIDWDKSERGSAAHEVVRTLALAFGLELGHCRAFLSSYRTYRPMPLPDLDTAAARYGLGQLHDTWLYDTIYRRGDDRPRRFLTPGPFTPFAVDWSRLRERLD